MGLLDDITPTSRIYPCRVRDSRDALDEADQRKLDELLADARWKHNTLAKALSSKGLEINVQSLQRHRENKCSCSKI